MPPASRAAYLGFLFGGCLHLRFGVVWFILVYFDSKGSAGCCRIQSAPRYMLCLNAEVFTQQVRQLVGGGVKETREPWNGLSWKGC